MRGAGAERTILAITNLPRLNARALISALPYRIKQAAEEDAFRLYLAKCARLMTENLARLSPGASYIAKEFHELTNPNRDEQSGEEIAADVFRRAGIEVIT